MKTVLFKRILIGFSLFSLMLTGFLLRIHNLSQFKVYPDSFQNLIVAENIRTYHSVVGFLGNGGMLYPDFFMWTRPGYPLLILLVNFLTGNTSIAAQLIAFAAGILAIPITYFFIKTIFHSQKIALAGALLMALA